jgi:riboflavin synthase
MTKKERVLKLTVHDEEQELEFELDYLSSLTFEERLKMMREKSREMLKQMIDHGHRRPFEIIKRT